MRVLLQSEVELPLSGGVYAIIDRKEDRWYIGSTVNLRRRFFAHRGCLSHGTHCNPWLLRCWQRRSRDFVFVVLETCSDNILVRREQWYIDNTPRVYNTADSATPGPARARTVWSQERREKQRQMMLGNTHLRGKKYSAETRAKYSAAAKARNWSPSPEHREKLRQAVIRTNKRLNKFRPQNQKRAA